MKNLFHGTLALALTSALIISGCSAPKPHQSSEIWSKVTLSFTGPALSEMGNDNPFLDYRLMVTFQHGDHEMVVPGFYAADGNAAESGASEGSIWQVRFRPDRIGEWTYRCSFRKGPQIAISDEPGAGTATAFDGEAGTIAVVPSATEVAGRLTYSGDHYQRFAGNGEYFLKGGADSPENFLAYVDFDNTYRYTIENRSGEADAQADLHRYEPHMQDWKTGDPTWKNGKGKAMIGALNYLAEKKMNAVYMLTMNIEGDGKDVWPYVSHDDRHRFDCSKLDQWEIVFDHMDNLGLMQHLVLQETENERLLDEGNTGPDRKLYYRELIARFGHHPMLTWNMGEENGPADFSPDGQTIEQREDMIKYFHHHDPYQNLVVIHSHSWRDHRDHLFEPHLGNPHLDGMSVQVGDKTRIHDVIKLWRQKSASEGRPWVMNMDEIGRHFRGADPDDRPDNNQDSLRQYVLWATLLAGGAGIEWYFGYQNPHNDLGCEDWRSRDRLWDYTAHALGFFRENLDYWDMEPSDELVSGPSYCFAKRKEVYVVYLPARASTALDLSDTAGEFSVQWFDPRNGGALEDAGNVTAGQSITLDKSATGQDYVALVRKI